MTLPADVLSDGTEFFSSFPSLSIGRVFLILEAGPDGIRLAYAVADTDRAAVEFATDILRAWSVEGKPGSRSGSLPSIGVVSDDAAAELLVSDLNNAMIGKGRANRFLAVRVEKGRDARGGGTE